MRYCGLAVLRQVYEQGIDGGSLGAAGTSSLDVVGGKQVLLHTVYTSTGKQLAGIKGGSADACHRCLIGEGGGYRFK